MKVIFLKARKIVINLIFLCTILVTAYSHEIYNENGYGIPLDLFRTNSSNGPEMEIYIMLPTSGNNAVYSTLYQSAVASWTGVMSGNMKVTTSYTTNSANANVSIISTKDAYSSIGVSEDTLGYTYIVDSTGTRIDSMLKAKNSTGIIRRARVYINYDISYFQKSNFRETYIE